MKQKSDFFLLPLHEKAVFFTFQILPKISH